MSFSIASFLPPYMRYSMSNQQPLVGKYQFNTLGRTIIETIVFILANWHTFDFSFVTNRTFAKCRLILEIRCAPQTRLTYHEVSIFTNIRINLNLHLIKLSRRTHVNHKSELSYINSSRIVFA